MRVISAPRMHVVKKEDKEAKLKDLIMKTLATGLHGPEFLVVARSPSSPVVRALCDLSSQVAAAGVSIRLVLTTEAANGSDEADRPRLPTFASCRVATDVRILDAHEQLVLGPAAAWTGDCMRREPCKCDAYECYADQSFETASWATRSFAQIWRAADPLQRRSAPRVAVSEGGVMDAIVAALSDSNSTAIAATRH